MPAIGAKSGGGGQLARKPGIVEEPDHAPGEGSRSVGDQNVAAVFDRQTLRVLYKFGEETGKPGDFREPHDIAADSKGNLYSTETYEGKRLQKFVFKGTGKVKKSQGVLWPTSSN